LFEHIFFFRFSLLVSVQCNGEDFLQYRGRCDSQSVSFGTDVWIPYIGHLFRCLSIVGLSDLWVFADFVSNLCESDLLFSLAFRCRVDCLCRRFLPDVR
jgi:hypothetical protein